MVNVADGFMFKVGLVVTFTLIVLVVVQPLLLVAFTVYVVVEVGVAVTGEPVALLKLPAGLQLYVLAPVAVSVVVLPAQTVNEDAVKVRVGKGLTVTVNVLVAVQPAVVPVRV